METDWRLFREQGKYLFAASLLKRAYNSDNPFNDHDHCEFCMAKFGKENGDLTQGYCTENRNIWICPMCYDDFKEQFQWKVR